MMESTRHIHVPGFYCIFLRNSFRQIMQSGGLWDMSMHMYPLLGGKAERQNMRWVFPAGAKSEFSYLESDQDALKYKGGQFALICFDQLEEMCLTADAEALTLHGWRPIIQIKEGENVASLSHTGQIEYCPVKRTFLYSHKGPIFRRTRHGLQFSATPNHRLLVETQARDGHRKLVRLDQIKRDKVVRLGALPARPDIDSKDFELASGRGIGGNHHNDARTVKMDDWLEYLGWWFAEGGVHESGAMSGPYCHITQSESSPYVPEIDALMRRLPWKHSRIHRHNSSIEWSIFSRQLANILKPLGDTYSKRIPRWIFSLSARQMAIFFHAFLKGDGSKGQGGSWSVTLANDGLIDDLQEMAFLLGSVANKNNRGGYSHLFIRAPARNASARIVKDELVVEHYEGPTVCLEVPRYHNFLVRQNGTFFFSGNSEFGFFYMLSRNRSTCGIRPYIRAGCLSGDTVIPLGDGRLIQMRDCTEKHELLSVTMPDGHQMSERPSTVVAKTVPDALRIVTTSNELLCSADHRFFRWTPTGMEEVPASKLAVGDFMPSARTMPHGAYALYEDGCYLIGYTIGDGGLTGREHIPRIMWTEKDEQHAAYIAKVAGVALSTKIGMHKRSGANAISIYTTTAPAAVDLLSRSPEIFAPSDRRSIPPGYTIGDAPAARALLQGLFDAEGSVSKDRIAIATTSRVLMHQVNVLLRRWGIMTRMDISNPKAPEKPMYRLTIRGPHAIAFMESIGFRMEKKQILGEELATRLRTSRPGFRCSDADLIPIDRAAIHHLRSFFGRSWWNRNRSIRRETADRVLSAAVDKNINPGLLAQWSSFAWERIASISQIGKMVAYDVTMPTEHTFYAATTVSHNCNPDPDSWLRVFIDWWIDPDTGYPIEERCGAIRWFIRIGDELVWADTKQELVEKFPMADLPEDSAEDVALVAPRSVAFVGATIYDNPALLKSDPNYLANLLALPEVERERLLSGNWNIRPAAGMVFNRNWFEIVDNAPRTGYDCRFWDFAATERKSMRDNPDETACVKGRMCDGTFYILDAQSVAYGPAQADELFYSLTGADRMESARTGIPYKVAWEQEPGSSGKKEAWRMVSALQGVDAEAVPSTSDKLIRARPLAAQARTGNVKIVKGDWNDKLLHQLHSFGAVGTKAHDDLVDAVSGCYNQLAQLITASFGMF